MRQSVSEIIETFSKTQAEFSIFICLAFGQKYAARKKRGEVKPP